MAKGDLGGFSKDLILNPPFPPLLKGGELFAGKLLVKARNDNQSKSILENRMKGKGERTKKELLAEIESLRIRLEEAEETLRAIRKGEVDGLVVAGAEGDRLFLLKDAEHAYRVYVEAMNEGAVTLSFDGTILYCNGRFADMVETPHQKVVGHSIYEFITSEDSFKPAFEKSKKSKEKIETLLKRKDDKALPVYLSLNPLLEDEASGVCVVVTDLGAVKESERQLKLLTSQLITAQEDERRRVAHDIHDSLGSQLSAVKFKIEDFFKMMPGASESITAALQEAINESRRIQMDLHPSILDDLGIAPALTWFCRKFETTYPLKIEQKMAIKEDDVPKLLKRTIYRISQEAFNNIAKHSKAKRVHLSLQKNSGTIELIIQDDGRGFELTMDTSKKGVGLSSMRERTESSGGTFCIESTKGKGTTVRACWPI